MITAEFQNLPFLLLVSEFPVYTTLPSSL